MLTTFQQIKESFVTAYEEQSRARKAIEKDAEKARMSALRYQRIAAQKMGEYHRLSSKFWQHGNIHWLTDLLAPTLKALNKATCLNFEHDNLHTFGMRNETPVFAHDEQGNVIVFLTFTPGDTSEGRMFIDTGEVSERYHQNSIGGMNGFGNATEEVTSLEVIIENLRRRYPELLMKHPE